jgi:hypothetical protein
MNIEQIKAARERLDALAELEKQYVFLSFGTVPTIESDFIKTIRTLLDNAINAPDLESLKLQSNPITDSIEGLNYIHGWNDAIEHLAPRIVREGFVVVPEELLQVSTELINKAFKIDEFGTLHIPMADLEMVSLFLKHKAMIAASKGD